MLVIQFLGDMEMSILADKIGIHFKAKWAARPVEEGEMAEWSKAPA